MKKTIPVICILLVVLACNNQPQQEAGYTIQAEVQQFLDEYTRKFCELDFIAQEAQWASNTKIIEGDSTNAIATRRASEVQAVFTGSEENINKAKEYLDQKSNLTNLQVLQLNSILYKAANNPGTVPDLVKERIKAETEQTEKLYGFDFKIDGEPVTPNEIDASLKEENDLDKRLKAWESSKEVGINLKEGLNNLRNLRNETVQNLNYSDYFSYQVSEYGMTSEEMMTLLRKIHSELFPLYRELHTYTRYELAKKFGVDEVPDYIPAHWLTNRWGQDWASMVTVEGFDIDAALSEKDEEWIIQQAERFYKSLGYDALPLSFWGKSSLFPAPKNADYKKNNHASAWHVNLDRDVRCLMSVEANSEWYETTHHELGHIYYFLEYSNADVPILLREGANRAFHEALGSLMGLAAMQKPFLIHLYLVDKNAEVDEMKALLKEALNYVVFIPWSAGVMSEFEHELYSNNLPQDQFNKKWWELKKKYQGIVPPTERGEEFCDAASKTHINNDAAQYYDYALSYLILFQLHDHIATEILNQDPRATDYFGKPLVGEFIRDIMYPGATIDWRELMKEATGEELSAKAMMNYFKPLMAYLKDINSGRKYTLEPVVL